MRARPMRFSGAVIHTQRGYRQVPDAFSQTPVGHDTAAVARQGMCCPTRACYCADRRKTCTLQPRLQVLSQSLLPAKEMWNPRDIGD